MEIKIELRKKVLGGGHKGNLGKSEGRDSDDQQVGECGPLGLYILSRFQKKKMVGRKKKLTCLPHSLSLSKIALLPTGPSMLSHKLLSLSPTGGVGTLKLQGVG